MRIPDSRSTIAGFLSKFEESFVEKPDSSRTSCFDEYESYQAESRGTIGTQAYA
jgi:hypothetical protein